MEMIYEKHAKIHSQEIYYFSFGCKQLTPPFSLQAFSLRVGGYFLHFAIILTENIQKNMINLKK